MTLPTDFQFSQSSLQDYEECPRRFQLRYVERRRWPALEVEPALEHERHLQKGAAFHRLVQQHLSGIPVERLSLTVTDGELRRWWRNYLESGPADLPTTRYPEVALSAPLAGFRVAAKYDLVALDVGERAVIVDWKTNRKRPGREQLAEQPQTKVYPYLLVRAGAELNGGNPIAPQQVEMIYWFSNAPAQPERFLYNAAQYEADEDHLSSLIEKIRAEIERVGDEACRRTDREKHCRYCCYRSLCRRGEAAGSLADYEADFSPLDDLDLEFEQALEMFG